jgi:ACS family hexuronate transporter-like MFS transporter
MAILFITVATTAHQAYMASGLTLPADLFPRRMVASAFGLAAMAGMLGSSYFQHEVGRIVSNFGYVPVFSIVGFLHPVAALIIVLFIRSRPQQAEGAIA